MMEKRQKSVLKMAVCRLLAFASRGVMAQQMLPYKNPDLPVEERVQDLLQQMTLEEKEIGRAHV